MAFTIQQLEAIDTAIGTGEITALSSIVLSIHLKKYSSSHLDKI